MFRRRTRDDEVPDPAVVRLPVIASDPVERPLRYVAIGDSIARGFQPTRPTPWRRDSCDFRLWGVPLRWFDVPAAAYPVAAQQMLSQRLGRPVDLDMGLTCSGMRTDHLWRDDGPSERLSARFAAPADFVTLTIGANDLLAMWFRYIGTVTALRPFTHIVPRSLHQAMRERFAPELQRTLVAAEGVHHRIRSILGWIVERSPSVHIVVTSYYLSHDTPATRARFSDPLLEAISAATESCPSASMLPLAPVLARPAINTRLTSRLDAFHPTTEGQRRIAKAVADESIRLLALATPAAGVGR